MFQKLETPKIVRGRPARIPVIMADAGTKIPTYGLQALSILIENETGPKLEKAAAGGISWGPGDATWLYVFDLTADETALLKTGPSQPIFLKITFSDAVLKYALQNFLVVANDAF